MENSHNPVITAIDLGTTKIVCLMGEKTSAGIRILGYVEAPSRGIQRGEIINNQTVLGNVVPLIAQLKEATGRDDIKEVMVGIAGQHIRCITESTSLLRKAESQEITLKEVNDLMEEMHASRVNPGETVLHVVPQSYNVDDHLGITDPVGMMGKKMDANYRLFIGRTDSAEHTRRCIASAGLSLNRLILEPLASAAATLHDDEKELGVAMLDIGGGTSDLLIYKDMVVRHTAVIPFGGDIITEDIRQGCAVTARMAEAMKIQYGSCYADMQPEDRSIVIPGIGGRDPREVSMRTLAHIIEARMDEIMEAVMYEIENAGYLGADKLQAGLVLTGGGSKLTHLPQYVKFKTGFDARIARPNCLDAEAPREINDVPYSCAVGLLMKGFEYDADKKRYDLYMENLEQAPPVPVAAGQETQEGPVKKSRRSREKGKGFMGSLFGGTIGDFFNDEQDKA